MDASLYSDFFSYLNGRPLRNAFFVDVDNNLTDKEATALPGQNCTVFYATKGVALSNRNPPLKKAVASVGFAYTFLRTGLRPDKNPSDLELDFIQAFGKGIYSEDLLGYVPEIVLYEKFVGMLNRVSKKGTAVILMTSSLAEVVREVQRVWNRKEAEKEKGESEKNYMNFFVKGLELKLDKHKRIISLDDSDSYTRMAMNFGLNYAKKKYASGLRDVFDCKIVSSGNSKPGDVVPNGVSYICPVNGKGYEVYRPKLQEVPPEKITGVRTRPRPLLLHEIEQSQGYAGSEIGKQV